MPVVRIDKQTPGSKQTFSADLGYTSMMVMRSLRFNENYFGAVKGAGSSSKITIDIR